MRHYSMIITALLLLLPGHSHAQGLDFVTALFKDVHSITFFGQASKISGSAPFSTDSRCPIRGMCGAGTEVLIDLPAADGLHLELGLGASFSRGLQAKSPDMDFHGAVRAFPSLAAYVTWPGLFGSELLQPYIGANFGLLELWNAQAYDIGRYEYSIKSQTFEWGGTGGVYFNIPRLDGLFVEASYKRRRFASLDYTFPAHADKQDSLPTGWPRELNLGGLQFAIGWQFELKRTPPVPAWHVGVWFLTDVDGQPLPSLVRQVTEHREQPHGSEREDLISGMLFVSADTLRTYRMELLYRRTRLDEEGRIIAAQPVEMREERGTFELNGRSITLAPDAPDRGKYDAIRLDDEILIPMRSTPSRLRFKRAKL